MNRPDLISRAVKLASLAHRNQRRKDDTPYVAHPIIVGFILLGFGFDETTVAAGILHDVIEDTPTTKEDLARDFGPAVAEIVAAVSENAKLPWVVRKIKLVEQIRRAPLAARAVAAADHINNLQDFLAEYEHIGPTLWHRWPDRTPEEKLAHDQRFVAMLKDGWEHPLIAEVEKLTEQEKKIADSGSNFLHEPLG